jgi:hypothetical protein
MIADVANADQSYVTKLDNRNNVSAGDCHQLTPKSLGRDGKLYRPKGTDIAKLATVEKELASNHANTVG